MNSGKTIGAVLVASVGFAHLSLAQVPEAAEGPGWTGLTEPGELIEARRGIMDEAERLMKPIDTFITTGEIVDATGLQSAAQTISRMLLAVPHLFPPTTNLYMPGVLEPPTGALPAVWQNFGAFLEFAEESEAAASSMAATDEIEALRAAAGRLRASCDACHAMSLRPYTPPQVTQEDIDFDFDSVFRNLR